MAEGREQRVSERISDVLSSPATRHWVKTALELALLRDPVEAAHDAKILSQVLGEWCESVLAASIANCERSVTSIERTLAAHDQSDWLRTALKRALHRDPVDAANDADALSALLDERRAAVGSASLVDGPGDRGNRGQMAFPLQSTWK